MCSLINPGKRARCSIWSASRLSYLTYFSEFPSSLLHVSHLTFSLPFNAYRSAEEQWWSSILLYIHQQSTHVSANQALPWMQLAPPPSPVFQVHWFIFFDLVFKSIFSHSWFLIYMWFFILIKINTICGSMFNCMCEFNFVFIGTMSKAIKWSYLKQNV